MTDLADQDGSTPESFVREFLIAYRGYELEAQRVMQEGDAEEARRAKAGDTGWYPEEADRTIVELFRTVLERFATPKVLAKQLGAHFASPPMADAAKTTFVGVESGRNGVVVRTLEIGHPALPPHECEYWLKLLDGRWRLDDRREQDSERRWRRLVF
jgi:hypothetical protein